MSNAPTLLNDDGSASMATALLMSHHGLRRDIARFALALRRLAVGDLPKIAALQAEWQRFRGTLHGHHEAEDQRLFPHLVSQHPDLGPVIEQLTADHRRIDPLLEQGDRAFADLGTDRDAAARVAVQLSVLLDEHLAVEEARVVPYLRGAKEFPPPGTDAEAEIYAQGFAWSSQDVAEEVLEAVYAMLPGILRDRLPAARTAFQQRCERVWGPTRAGASRLAIPDWLLNGDSQGVVSNS